MITAAEAQLYRVRRGTTPGRTTKAQQDRDAARTIVSVELLTGKQGVGLAAQQWRQTFEQIGFSVRIRRAILDDEPEVKEEKFGRLREVKVVGRLDRSGKLVFPDNRTFTRSQSGKLAEWLKSLKVYGAQGSPDGQPVWGLSETQFAALYNRLSEPVTADLAAMPLEKAIDRMKLPREYPLRFTDSAKAALSQEPGSRDPVRKTVQGHGKGTALALVLRDYGLGFRPLRKPDGTIELAVASLKKTADVWPVGWELKESRPKTVPELFKFIPVELDKVPLVEALDGISQLTGVAIHIDYYGLEARGIDVEQITVSYPAKKTSWSVLLNGITVRHKLNRVYRIDEKGKPFVWIKPLIPGDVD